MSKSTREIGRSLEHYVLETLHPLDSKLHMIKNSGANNEKGDISGKNWKIECKKRNTEDITLKKKVWDKLCSEIQVGTNQIPLYILENSSKDKFVVMSLEDFSREMEKIYGSSSWQEK